LAKSEQLTSDTHRRRPRHRSLWCGRPLTREVRRRPDHPRGGRLAEGDAETQVRAYADQRLVQVVHRLYEVGLADHDIDTAGRVDGDHVARHMPVECRRHSSRGAGHVGLGDPCIRGESFDEPVVVVLDRYHGRLPAFVEDAPEQFRQPRGKVSCRHHRKSITDDIGAMLV
jgi:hypothetical protein